MNDKIKKELDKIQVDNLYDVFGEIKEHITSILTEHQKRKEEEANKVQSQIDNINGHN